MLALVFLVWAGYAFAGAGLLRLRLPLLRPALLAIGAIYTLRGLELIPNLIRIARSAGYPLRQTVFSAIALVLGVLHLAGAAHKQKKR